MLLYEYMANTAPVRYFASEPTKDVTSLRSWCVANCLRRKRFPAASASHGCITSQRNASKSPTSLTITFTPFMRANIMTYFICRLYDAFCSHRLCYIFCGTQGGTNGTRTQTRYGGRWVLHLPQMRRTNRTSTRYPLSGGEVSEMWCQDAS